MKETTLDLLLVHCQGEIGKVIVGGAPEIPGDTILDKMNHINEVDDGLRRFVTFEPRAHVAMTVNLLIPPCRADADAAFIVLQPDKAHPMSGSNCICVVTALLETGRVKMIEPETIVKLDTAAGLITARAKCHNGRCLSVSLDNVPAFAVSTDVMIETLQWGKIKADIAFGGVFYALIDVHQIDLTLSPDKARALAEAGISIKATLKDQIKVEHPEISGLNEIAYVMFRDKNAQGEVLTCTTLKPGRVDRSPCGTGSSANLAALYAKGMIEIGEHRISRSIIGGTFKAEVIAETQIGPYRAIVPRITGSAEIYGEEKLYVRKDDPFRNGFALADTWGPQVGELFKI